MRKYALNQSPKQQQTLKVVIIFPVKTVLGSIAASDGLLFLSLKYHRNTILFPKKVSSPP